MNPDFVEMLSGLSAAGLSTSSSAHTPRGARISAGDGDLDIWVRADATNAPRVLEALKRFGAPLLDLTLEDLSKPGTVFQIGTAPARIEILTGISGSRSKRRGHAARR